MIGDILDFARASAGEQFPFRARATDLRGVVIAVVEELREVTPDRPIELFVPEALNTDCDPDRIGQALGNLVRNAVQHGVKGITVSALFEEGDVVLRVLSVGPAIPDSERTTLFDPFKHGPSHDGLGLGLYIVNEVVRTHGGRVTVQSSDLGNQFEMHHRRLVSRLFSAVRRRFVVRSALCSAGSARASSSSRAKVFLPSVS